MYMHDAQNDFVGFDQPFLSIMVVLQLVPEDYSCRFIFIELQKLLIICCCDDSVALAVENPEFFNRIAETLCSKAAMRFVILLWGKKSSVAPDIVEEIPVFSYDEIIDLGQESRKAFSDSNDASELILFNINYFRIFNLSIRNF